MIANLWQRLAGRPAYRPGALYKTHRPQWQAWQRVDVLDALNISLRYGFDNVAWGRW